MKLPQLNPHTKAIARQHRRQAKKIVDLLCTIGIKHSRRKVSMALLDLTSKQTDGMVRHLEAVRRAAIKGNNPPKTPEYVSSVLGGSCG